MSKFMHVVIGIGVSIVITSGIWYYFTNYVKTSDALSCFKNDKDDNILFTYNGKTMSVNVLPYNIKKQIYQINKQYYENNKNISDNIALQLYLNKDKKEVDFNLTLSETLNKDFITDDEVKNYYKQQKQSFANNITYEQIYPSLKQNLYNIKLQKLKEDSILSKKSNIKYNRNLVIPCGDKVELSQTNPIKVQANTNDKKISITRLMDISCTSCRAQYLSTKMIFEEYKNNINLNLIPIAENKDNINFDIAKLAYCVEQKKHDDFVKLQDAMWTVALRNNANIVGKREEVLTQIFKENNINFEDYKLCLSDNSIIEKINKNNKYFQEIIQEKDTHLLFINEKQILTNNPEEIKYIIDNFIFEY